ncbi:hypothetical protein SO3561_10247 [Streptomyces olivochromogenes]|uniref:Uncharacterized protein n=1 Tax=Streptomyces olivochromogenes TaxID=1963 RepID=A0A286PGJ3_STROL|nr:hypothetical protein SO3561_10247 [Streptomyces olivochromogenes]
MSVLIHAMHLKKCAVALLARAFYNPAHGKGAVASALKFGQNLDKLKPHVTVALTEVDSADSTVAIAEDEHCMIVHERCKEGSLLVLLPRPVRLLNQRLVRLLVQFVQPLVIFLSGEAHLN